MIVLFHHVVNFLEPEKSQLPLKGYASKYAWDHESVNTLSIYGLGRRDITSERVGDWESEGGYRGTSTGLYASLGLKITRLWCC